ncbi:hypothetical protein [Dehalobacter sp. 4CP]|uniref:hypothetical protein n=1 Tax=Dehalobacter sp. CP TaxID=2594474 RepID=UPI0039EA2E87
MKINNLGKHHIFAMCLFIIGIVSLIKQMVTGFDGYINHYPWGLYIGLFFTAAGGGAGLLIILGFGMLSGTIENSTSKQLYTCALAMFITAGCLIFADLGYPIGFYNMIISPNLSAPMNYDAIALLAAIIMSLLAAIKIKSDGAKSKNFAVAGIAIGIILLGVESWLVAVSVRQDIWAVMLGAGPALFQALTIGLAVVVLFHNGGSWRNGLVMALFLVLTTQLIDLFAGIGNMNHLGSQLTMLAKSYTFWISSLGMLACLLIGVLSSSKKTIAVLTVFSIAMAKLSIIWAGQSSAALDQLTFTGEPHLVLSEILVVIGMIGLGALIYSLAAWFVQVRLPGRITKDEGANI